MRRIRIFEEAATEVIEAAAWYERERPGLGVAFSAAIDAAFDVPAKEAPSALFSSPYDIVVYEASDEVIVVAVTHHSRKPGYWRNRLSP